MHHTNTSAFNVLAHIQYLARFYPSYRLALLLLLLPLLLAWIIINFITQQHLSVHLFSHVKYLYTRYFEKSLVNPLSLHAFLIFQQQQYEYDAKTKISVDNNNNNENAKDEKQVNENQIMFQTWEKKKEIRENLSTALSLWYYHYNIFLSLAKSHPEIQLSKDSISNEKETRMF